MMMTVGIRIDRKMWDDSMLAVIYTSKIQQNVLMELGI